MLPKRGAVTKPTTSVMPNRDEPIQTGALRKYSIRVVSEYKDDMVATKEDMVKAVPKEDLLNTAKAMIDVYTHHWQE